MKAVKKDPGYGLAYAGLADSYVLLGWNSHLAPKEAFPTGKVAAMTALRLDANLAEAHTSLAAILWLYDWRWEEAEAEFKRSLDLSPNYATGNHWYAEYVMTMGRQAEAITRMKNGQDLDPLSLIINVAVGWAFYHARRYDEAIEQLRRTVELDPNYPVTYWSSPKFWLLQAEIAAGSAGKSTRRNRSWKRRSSRNASMLGSI